MNTKKHYWVFYLIALTILTTIVVQFYWNYKNYQENKRQLVNEIQVSFDNAIEEYYADLAEEEFFSFISTTGKYPNFKKLDSLFPQKKQIKSVRKKTKNVDFSISEIKITDSSKQNSINTDSIFINLTNKIMIDENIKWNDTLVKKVPFDSLAEEHKIIIKKNNLNDIKVFKGKQASDSLRMIEKLNPIIISFLNETVEYAQIDSLFKHQLNDKQINLKYGIRHYIDNHIEYNSNETIPEFDVVINSKSTFVKDFESLELAFINPVDEALKRSATGILLSFILALAVIASLFYLLRIINKQKELAEIKNDLISNITHEFKTPITTVSMALEAIENFNANNDQEKTKKYLSISSLQLKKLHQMVEKLLETATLDSEKLFLKKEPINLIELIDKLSQKHQLLATNKTIKFTTNVSEKILSVDAFYLENAVSNLIDNAVKYGGDIIEINCQSLLNNFEIQVADNGGGIDKVQKEKIFDKFYRVPKGNTHDVKGFGIGLYYTKKIIEKHHGKIELTATKNSSVFKITLTNE